MAPSSSFELPTPAECASFFGLADGSPAQAPTGKTQTTICACLLTVNVQSLYPQDGDTDPDAPSGASLEGHVSPEISYRPKASQSQLFKKRDHGRAKHSSLPRTSGTPAKSTRTAQVVLNYGSPGTMPFSMTGTASLCSFSLMTSLPSTGTPGFLRSVSVGLPSASCLFVLMRPMIRLASVTLGGRFCLAFYSGLPKARISYCLGTSISISTPHSPPPPAFWTTLDAFALWIPSTSTATLETPTPGTLPMDLELPGLITSLFPGFGRCHRPVAGLTPPLTGANNAPITLLFNPGSGAMYTLAVTPGQEDPGLTPQLCGLLRGSRSCARSAEACHFLEYRCAQACQGYRGPPLDRTSRTLPCPQVHL